MQVKFAKRFYKTATVASHDLGFEVRLDGKPLRTPGGQPMQVPTEALARALAEEWEQQSAEIVPLTMPLTRYVNTALDRVGRDPAPAIGEILGFARSDLLCYRAADQAGLEALQKERWQPLLDWTEERFGACLTVTAGIVPIEQPLSAIEALTREVEALSPFQLASAAAAAGITGSAVLALALAHRRLDAEEAFRLSRLDEDWQAEQWGEDAEAAERRERARQDLEVSVRIMRLAEDVA